MAVTKQLGLMAFEEINLSTPQTVIDSFIDFLDVKPRTARNYIQGVCKMFEHFAANGLDAVSQWRSISPRVLRDAFVSFRAEMEKRYTPSTAQLYVTAARLFVRWLASNDICANFTDHVKGVAVSLGHKRDALTVEQSTALFKVFSGSKLVDARNRAFVALMLASGLRCVEVIRADVGDLEEIQGAWFLRVHGKKRSGKDEIVAVPLQVKSLIDAYLKMRGTSDASAPLFASCSNRNKGGRLSTSTISHIIKKGLRAIGLDSKRITAHSLRHAFVTNALLNGVAEKEVIQACRHKSANVIAVYRHDIDRMKNTAEATVANLIFGAA